MTQTLLIPHVFDYRILAHILARLTLFFLFILCYCIFVNIPKLHSRLSGITAKVPVSQ